MNAVQPGEEAIIIARKGMERTSSPTLAATPSPDLPPRRLRRSLAARTLAIVFIVCIFAAGVAWIVTWAGPESTVEIDLPTKSAAFSADQAQRYLVDVCRLGPRPTASRAMVRQQEILQRHFEALGAVVELQRFEGTQPSLGGQSFPCVNLIVHWHPKKKRRVLIGCHYDTRPYADQEPVFRNRKGAFVGANDGGSGVAFLMELGRTMPAMNLQVGVDFVFFDAEEYILENNRDKYFLGSEHFVDQYTTQRPSYAYDAVVVVDMIGDKDLTLHPDQRSAARAGRLVREIWGIAEELGVRQFDPEPKHDVLDDHIAFLDAGIPAVDLIDFDYPHWHRLTDTPDRCSGASLAAVAKVLMAWLEQRR